MSAAAADKARRGRRTKSPGTAGPAPAMLTQLSLGEVSCVDVPANMGARHLMFKNLAALAKSDAPPGGTPPGEGQDPPAGDPPNPDPDPDATAKGAADETFAALTARCADLQSRLAERDRELAWMADSMATMRAAAENTAKGGQQKDQQQMTEKNAPGSTPPAAGDDVTKAQADAIAKAVETAVKAATADLTKRAEAAESRAEKAENVAQAEKAARELTDLTKAAEGPDYCNLPGDPIVKARALGHVAAMPEAERNALQAALKAGNAAMGRNFKEVGKSGDYSNTGATGGTAAEDELDRLAKAAAKESKVSYAKAYAGVMADNPDLYARFKAEQTARARAV